MIKLSVRDLAFFVYQSGDLSNTNLLKRAEEGKNIHYIRQKEYKDEQTFEYYIESDIKFNNEYLKLQGFIDGVLNFDNLEIEEIKSTKLNFDEVFRYKQEHLAQAKIYAYLLAKELNKEIVIVNLLYINVNTYHRKNYSFLYNINELESFLLDTLTYYFDYYSIIETNYLNRIKSITNFNFPYDNIRNGQLDMINEIDNTFKNNDVILIEAPTGIGKTIASIYAGVKNLKLLDDKLFYLTAKNSGKYSALNAFSFMIKKGLKIKVLELTSKEKICFNTSIKDCNECKYGKKYFDKINDVVLDIISNYDLINKDIIASKALEYEICPFELSLDISTNVDALICDYNYLFDPLIRLKRYFENNTYKPYILCDECHNLLSRSQDMYSASFSINDLLAIYNIFIEYPLVKDNINKLINYIVKTYDRYLVDKEFYFIDELDTEVYDLLYILIEEINNHNDDSEIIKYKNLYLDSYLNINKFLKIANLYSKNHIMSFTYIDNILYINIKCLNAKEYLSEIIDVDTKGIAFFSATLKPFNYYNDYFYHSKIKTLEIDSPFDKNNLLKIIRPISTKYKDRLYSIQDIVDTIYNIVNVKLGKYIVFLPSYEYLNLLKNNFKLDNYELYIQEKGSYLIKERNIYDIFSKKENILGLFVLGGIYSEGVDYIGDLLDGAIIIGVGMPQINEELNYYKAKIKHGFDYIYTYPGLTKVIQACGRVIRQETDYGLICLIDDRYKTNKYLKLLPTSYDNINICLNNKEMNKIIKEFYNKKI